MMLLQYDERNNFENHYVKMDDERKEAVNKSINKTNNQQRMDKYMKRMHILLFLDDN